MRLESLPLSVFDTLQVSRLRAFYIRLLKMDRQAVDQFYPPALNVYGRHLN